MLRRHELSACYVSMPGKPSAVQSRRHHYHHHHLFLNRDGRLGTTDDFSTSFLQFSLFSTALWDLANSRPVHSLILSSHLLLPTSSSVCLVFFPLSLCLARWFRPDLTNGRHPSHAVSLTVKRKVIKLCPRSTTVISPLGF